jgi:hypothetical protein
MAKSSNFISDLIHCNFTSSTRYPNGPSRRFEVPISFEVAKFVNYSNMTVSNHPTEEHQHEKWLNHGQVLLYIVDWTQEIKLGLSSFQSCTLTSTTIMNRIVLLAGVPIYRFNAQTRDQILGLEKDLRTLLTKVERRDSEKELKDEVATLS